MSAENEIEIEYHDLPDPKSDPDLDMVKGAFYLRQFAVARAAKALLLEDTKNSGIAPWAL